MRPNPGSSEQVFSASVAVLCRFWSVSWRIYHIVSFNVCSIKSALGTISYAWSSPSGKLSISARISAAVPWTLRSCKMSLTYRNIPRVALDAAILYVKHEGNQGCLPADFLWTPTRPSSAAASMALSASQSFNSSIQLSLSNLMKLRMSSWL